MNDLLEYVTVTVMSLGDGINGRLFLQLTSMPEIQEIGLTIGFKHLIFDEIKKVYLSLPAHFLHSVAFPLSTKRGQLAPVIFSS